MSTNSDTNKTPGQLEIERIRDSIASSLRTQLNTYRTVWSADYFERVVADLAANAAGALMEHAELAARAKVWAEANARADALIDRCIDLRKQHDAFIARAEPFGPSLARREADKIQREMDALEEPIALACNVAEIAQGDLLFAAQRIAEPDPSSSASGVLGERKHWRDCAINHGGTECDMGPDCGTKDT